MLTKSLTLLGIHFRFRGTLQIAKSLKWLCSEAVLYVVAADLEKEQFMEAEGARGTEHGHPLMEFASISCCYFCKGWQGVPTDPE